MDLANSGYRVKAILKLTDGREFRGTVNVNNVLRTQNDISDYLVQVGRDTFVQAGQAMYYDHGKVFLLGTGVEDFSAGPLFRTLRMIEVTATLSHTRPHSGTDPLTGLAKKDADTSLGNAYVNMLATSKISDAFHTADSKFRLITNAAVQVNDRVGTYVITFVESRHGLQFAECR